MMPITSTTNPHTGFRALVARYRELYQSERLSAHGPAAPHPGDILYWVGWISAGCALLFFATR